MPNKVTMRMPSKSQYIIKYGDSWYYHWEKDMREYNIAMQIATIDWIESQISKFKNERFGVRNNKIVMSNIYSSSWQFPIEIQFNELPADLKYHDTFEKFKPLK